MAISAAIIGALGGAVGHRWFWDQTLTGWNSSGGISLDGSNGNPAPSLAALPNAYSRMPVPGFASLAGRTIELDMYANPGTALCNFYFGCDSSGAGQYFRLDCRSSYFSGVAPTLIWGTAVAPTAPIAPYYAPATWHAVKIVVNAAGTACDVYVNGEPAISGHSITLKGNYIGVFGDGGSGGKFDNFKVT